MRMFNKFLKNTSGATAIEYGLIAALIGTVIVTGVTALGTANTAAYESIEDQLNAARG